MSGKNSKADILRGCRIVVVGRPYGNDTDHVEYLIESAGGEAIEAVSDGATHLITTETPPDDEQVRQARANGIPVISWRWLKVSLDYGERQELDDYHLGGSGRRRSSASSSRKKSADDSEGDEDASSKPAKKKSKTSKGSKKETAADKKAATGNTAQSSSTASGSGTGQAAAPSGRGHLPPVDPASAYKHTHAVFQREDGVVMDCLLNQVDVSHGRNHNKFWAAQLLEPVSNKSGGKYVVFTKWGRVGEPGSTKEFPEADLTKATKLYEDKFKSKVGLKWEERNGQPKAGKYTMIRGGTLVDDGDDGNEDADTSGSRAAGSSKGRRSASSGASSSNSLETKLDKRVFDLGQMIFSKKLIDAVLDDLGYDHKKTPLGKLTPTSIEKGYLVLTQLSNHINSGNPSPATLDQLSSQYYTWIPHAFGRQAPPRIATQDAVSKESLLVDTLRQMTVGDRVIRSNGHEENEEECRINPIDAAFKRLNLQTIEPVDKKSAEWKHLEKMCLDSKGWSHDYSYSVKDIFRIERHDEDKRFASWMKTKPDDRRLLWHGSRLTNYSGILSQGLRIAPPEAPVSGYMFGKGIYLADCTTKSLNYCYSELSNNEGLLLLCEAQVGDPLLLFDSDEGAADLIKKKGKHSTFGKGMTRFKDDAWVDAGARLEREELKGVKMPVGNPQKLEDKDEHYALIYNERILYAEDQLRFRYLFRLNVQDDNYW